MSDLHLLTDEQLWRAASRGDAGAADMLAERYNRLVKACARPYFLAGGDGEDLIQEGMLGFLSAIRQFDLERGVPFKTFAERCIRNRILTAIKSAARFKHSPLNHYVSFESPQFDLRQTVRSTEYLCDPEELLLTKERVDEIMHSMRVNLSGFESKVLALFLDGLSYSEISEQLQKPTKSVDNAVQRIRKKLAQFL